MTAFFCHPPQEAARKEEETDAIYLSIHPSSRPSATKTEPQYQREPKWNQLPHATTPYDMQGETPPKDAVNRTGTKRRLLSFCSCSCSFTYGSNSNSNSNSSSQGSRTIQSHPGPAVPMKKHGMNRNIAGTARQEIHYRSRKEM